MSRDVSGDGMLGSHYYNRGHVTFKRNIFGSIVTVLAVIGTVFIVSVAVGALFYSKPAQNVLQDVIGGRSNGEIR